MASSLFESMTLICLFVFFTLFSPAHCHNISCSNQIITTKGSFPEKLSEIPSDFDCVIKFEIPSGFVVRFSLKSDPQAENLTKVTYVINAQNTVDYFPISKDHSYIFATARTAELHIHTGNETVNMQIKYHFIDIRHFTGTIVDAGTIQSLNMGYGTFMTFRASETNLNTQIELATVTEHSKNDIFSHVFVYEGLNLEGDCIGTLANYKNKITPTYQDEDSTEADAYLSIVYFNSRQDYTDSYVIANTKNSLENINNYTLRISDEKKMLQFSDFSTKSSASTIFCLTNCAAMYIDELKFLEGDGQVEIMPFAPYHRKPRNPQEYDARRSSVIIYHNATFNSLVELPQQVPMAMFTIIIKNATIGLKVTTNDYKWQIPRKGRKVTIYSPSYWNVSAPSYFSYKFELESQILDSYEFYCTVNILSMNATDMSDKFRVIAGNEYELSQEYFLGCEDDLDICWNDLERREIHGIGDSVEVKFSASTWPSSAIVQIQMGGKRLSGFWGLINYIFSGTY